MVEDDHGPLLRRQAPEAPVELVTHGHGALGVGRHRLERRVEGELDDLPLSAPFRGAVAGADEQSMQPGVEPVRVTQTAHVEPGLEERVLHGIGGVLVIAEDEPGGPEEPIGPAGRQCREGIEIAPLRPNHEVSLHRSTSDVAAVWPLYPVWGRRRTGLFHLRESPGRNRALRPRLGDQRRLRSDLLVCRLPGRRERFRHTRLVKLYFAAPLFSAAERDWNAALAGRLRAAGHEVFLPQEQEKGKDAAGVFATDVGGIDWADALVAIMDGPDPDPGTAWECGYAYGKMPVVLVRTDFRVSGAPGMPYNAMLIASATLRLDLSFADMETVEAAVLDALRRLEPA